ncbi:hypothetical protein [Pseudomonas sp. On1]|uniref:hypothetical protein n=1 Tax=Pseudomonas sp. On1 TaxID=3083258 RepID=UPI0029B6B8B9|nr:hypothetical protein [Pseudomonas sp. On1]MDX2309882.1 hypothetical protein [Pseudomonas sp. On1]
MLSTVRGITDSLVLRLVGVSHGVDNLVSPLGAIVSGAHCIALSILDLNSTEDAQPKRLGLENGRPMYSIDFCGNPFFDTSSVSFLGLLLESRVDAPGWFSSRLEYVSHSVIPFVFSV